MILEWKNDNGAAMEFDLSANWQRCFCHVSLGRNDSCRLSLASSPRFNSTFPLKRLNCSQLFISETSLLTRRVNVTNSEKIAGDWVMFLTWGSMRLWVGETNQLCKREGYWFLCGQLPLPWLPTLSFWFCPSSLESPISGSFPSFSNWFSSYLVLENSFYYF